MLTVIPLQQLRTGQVLCLDRKIHANPVQDRQAAFVNTFGQGCDGAMVSYQEALLYAVPWMTQAQSILLLIGGLFFLAMFQIYVWNITGIVKYLICSVFKLSM